MLPRYALAVLFCYTRGLPCRVHVHIFLFLHQTQYCCAALCLVAQDVRNCVLIINEGAIPHMLAGAKDGDVVTKQSCCAVLSTLSSKVSTFLVCVALMGLLNNGSWERNSLFQIDSPLPATAVS